MCAYKFENLGVSRKVKIDKDVPETGQAIAFVRAMENAIEDGWSGKPSPLEVFSEMPKPEGKLLRFATAS
jgi:hypothetical protein